MNATTLRWEMDAGDYEDYLTNLDTRRNERELMDR